MENNRTIPHPDRPEFKLGKGPYRFLHKNLKVMPNEYGKGLYVVGEKIKKGEVTWYSPDDAENKDVCLSWKEAMELPEVERDFFLTYAYSDENNNLVAPLNQEGLDDDYTYYLNHSCNPNGVGIDFVTTVAERDIEVGEQMTADYGTFNAPPPPEYLEAASKYLVKKCLCGSPNCRGIFGFGAAAYRNPEFRKRYKTNMVPQLMKLIIEEFPEEKDLYISWLKENDLSN